MGSSKSLDITLVTSAMITDAFARLHIASDKIRDRDLKTLFSRTSTEGLSFLTKTLPRLCKGLDKALAGTAPLDAAKLGFKTQPDSQLPRFLGTLFQVVLSNDGTLRSTSADSVKCVGALRDILMLFYKYEMPYAKQDEDKVLTAFIKAEEDVAQDATRVQKIRRAVDDDCRLHKHPNRPREGVVEVVQVARQARRLVHSLFARFDPRDIKPHHGPGAVSTKEKLSEKWSKLDAAAQITDVYPWDAFFCASTGHVCDTYVERSMWPLPVDKNPPAKVILVPKDSRGPRLISEESLACQYIQQGLKDGIYHLVEHHRLTRECVRFTHQEPNRNVALLSSKDGYYATLDLKEASDRVSLELVRLLFPEHVVTCMEACRSSSTMMPDGKLVALNKFAPMGSALCFPVLAITVWALLTAVMPDIHSRERVYVYGDDVIVRTDTYERAIKTLEAFGLKANLDKCCHRGSFRESCGMDAFNGVCVTPVKIKTRWSESLGLTGPSPEVFASWIEYENALSRKLYPSAARYIAEHIRRVYGYVNEDVPSYLEVPRLVTYAETHLPARKRYNKDLQRFQWSVRDVRSTSTSQTIGGWNMLHRFLIEASGPTPSGGLGPHWAPFGVYKGFSVRKYTRRGDVKIARSWL